MSKHPIAFGFLKMKVATNEADARGTGCCVCGVARQDGLCRVLPASAKHPMSTGASEKNPLTTQGAFKNVAEVSAK